MATKSHKSTEGQRLLADLVEPAAAIAARVGASKSAITSARRGETLPHPDVRRALEREFSIPVDAWDRAPGSTSISTPTLSTTTSIPERGTLAHLRLLLEDVECVRTVPGLSAGEVAKLSAESRLLAASIARHEREDAESQARIEARACEMLTPLRGILLSIANDHPEASDQLIAAIDEWTSKGAP